MMNFIYLIVKIDIYNSNKPMKFNEWDNWNLQQPFQTEEEAWKAIGQYCKLGNIFTVIKVTRV